MANFKEANEKIVDGITEGYEKIEEGVVTGYQKIESGVVEGYKKTEDKFTGAFLTEDGDLKTGGVGGKVVDGYKKVENTVVGGFHKMTDKFVGKFLTREGETLEDAKARIAEDQKTREAAQKARIENSLAASGIAGKRNG